MKTVMKAQSIRRAVSLMVGIVTVFVSLNISPALAATNLIANPSVETAGTSGLPQSWAKGGSGNNNRVLTYPVAGFDGAKALRAEITTYVDGDVKWYFAPVAISSGQKLTYADSFRSNATSFISVRFQLTDGTYKYFDPGSNIPASPSWTSLTRTFTVPTYALPVVNVTAYQGIKSIGWLESDVFSLFVVPPADVTAPTVSIQAVAPQPVQGVITLTADAADNVGVTGVQFLIDGVNAGLELTAAPYAFSWDTSLVSDGTHIVSATAHDAAPNSATAANVNVSVANHPVGTLVVTSHVVNDEGGTAIASGFTDHVAVSGGSEISASPFSGSETGVTRLLAPGTYVVSQDAMSWYSRLANSGDCSASGVITVVADQVAHCDLHVDDIFRPSPPPNLILNPSVETAAGTLPQSWAKGGSGNNTRILSYPVAGYDGAKALRAEITNYVDGDVKWYFSPIATSSGQELTFSDWYRSNATAFISVRFQLQNGAYKYFNPGSNIPPASAWTSLTRTFIVPTYESPVVNVTVFHGFKSIGWLETDNFSLNVTPPPDVTAPAISIQPVNPQPVQGVVTLTADATDARGVTGVQFMIDGVNVGSELAVPSYTFVWDTSLIADGTHVISATAHDAALNSTTSANLNVLVANNPVGTLVISTDVVNDEGGTAQASDFTDHVSVQGGSEIPTSPFPGSGTGVSLVLAPGTYVISGNAMAWYDRLANTGDCDSSGIVTVVAGETAHCGLHVDDILRPPMARVTVNAVIVNNDGGVKTLADFPLFIDAMNVQSGEENQLDGGSFVVSAINDPSYTELISGDCDAQGNLTAAADESKQCVITFDDIEPAPPMPTNNAIANPSMETASSNPTLPLSWKKGGSGDNTRVLSYPVAGYDGVKAIKSQITRYVTGDAKWYFDPIEVTSGQQLTYSDIYTSNTASYLTARYTLSDGTFKYPVLGATLPAATTWTQVSRTFVVPTYALPVVSVTVFHTIASVGWVTTDAAVLAAFVPPPSDPANLVVNGTLESISAASPDKPAYWGNSRSDGATAVFSYPVPGKDSAMAAKVEVTEYAYGAGAKWYFQPVAVEPKADYESVSWYKSTVSTILEAQILLADGSYSYTVLKNLPPAADWTEARGKFNVPADAVNVTILHFIQAVGTLTTDEYSLKKLPPSNFAAGMISLNFDDGPLSVYENAIPRLNAAGIKSTQYIVTEYLGHTNYVDEIQVASMAADGHEIGAHTRTHPHLTQLTQADQDSQIAGSKSDLLALGYDTVSLAYPFGDFNDQVEQSVMSAGYRGARSVRSGFNNKNTDPFALVDKHIESNVTIEQVQGWIAQAVADKTWLVLEFHDVNDSGDQYSATPEMLDQIITAVQTSGISVVSMSDGLTAMGY